MENNKKALAKVVKTALKSLNETQIEQANANIVEKVCLFLKKNGFKRIGIYVSFGLEPITTPIIEFAFNQKISVFVPKVTGTRQMEFYEIKNLIELVKNPQFNFLEPTGDKTRHLKSPNSLDVLFLPLTVFDSKLNRIGTGFGYYDSWIADKHYQGLKVGLARQASFSETEIETNQFDVPLDYVITESQVYGW